MFIVYNIYIILFLYVILYLKEQHLKSDLICQTHNSAQRVDIFPVETVNVTPSPTSEEFCSSPHE